jgi:hypothetical protein
MRDLYHNALPVSLAIPVDQAGTDAWSKYVDLAGSHGCIITVHVGDLTGVDGSNYLTPVLYEATATPASAGSYSAVAASDLLGGFSKIDATTEDSTIQTVGYKGICRYVAVKCDYTGTGITAGCVSVEGYVAFSDHEPTSGRTVTTGTVS